MSTTVRLQFAKGFLKMVSVLAGAVVGYLVAGLMGLINFAPVGEAGLLAFPIPLQFGMSFHASVIVPIVLITIVNVMQTVGDLTGITVFLLNLIAPKVSAEDEARERAKADT